MNSAIKSYLNKIIKYQNFTLGNIKNVKIIFRI